MSTVLTHHSKNPIDCSKFPELESGEILLAPVESKFQHYNQLPALQLSDGRYICCNKYDGRIHAFGERTHDYAQLLLKGKGIHILGIWVSKDGKIVVLTGKEIFVLDMDLNCLSKHVCEEFAECDFLNEWYAATTPEGILVADIENDTTYLVTLSDGVPVVGKPKKYMLSLLSPFPMGKRAKTVEHGTILAVNYSSICYHTRERICVVPYGDTHGDVKTSEHLLFMRFD